MTEKEKRLVGQLRYPERFVARKNIDIAIPEKKQDEIRTLFDKMDEYIEIEGKIKRAMGYFDEMYVLELSNVKDRLKNMLKDIGKE